ncbi:MAG: 16S rRNA (uracil(1498)-N(3))-methyltransferase [Mariprofundaceae bacterium]|nr:16S rRNA (uracil(1498)-N(3))-methyltransferase [Mariprofundaceae bacterium]
MHCRIYLNVELAAQTLVQIEAEQARYLRQVMRLQAGDPITVFNGSGGEYQAELTFLAKDGGECRLADLDAVNRELPCGVHIIQAANKSEKIETVLQKATELGASSFQIVNSERSTLKLPDNKREKRLLRWQKIVVEAAEQSERTAVPSVAWLTKLDQVQTQGAAFALHPRDAQTWATCREHIQGFNDITLAIGPEGGWTTQDLQCLHHKGFATLTFGARVMRTETAAAALLAAIQAVV